jgi:NADH-quinone oxidoreductase subunit G
MIDTRDDVVVRIRPRPTLEVNRHFICDTGRQHYRWMNRGDRIEAPLVRHEGRMRATDWDTALDRLAGLVREAEGPVVLLASGRSSTEALGWVQRLLDGKPVTAAVQVPTGDVAPLPGVPNLALRAERAPNGDGARLAGYQADWTEAVAAAGQATLTIVLDADLDDQEAALVNGSSSLVVLGTVEDERLTHATLTLPIASVAEENGTFVNRDQRVQRYMQARPAPGMAQPAWWVAGEAWARSGNDRSAPQTAAEAFAGLGAWIAPLAGLTHADLGLTGRLLEGAAVGGTR